MKPLDYSQPEKRSAGFASGDWWFVLGASVPLWLVTAAGLAWAKLVAGRQTDGSWYDPRWLLWPLSIAVGLAGIALAAAVAVRTSRHATRRHEMVLGWLGFAFVLFSGGFIAFAGWVVTYLE